MEGTICGTGVTRERIKLFPRPENKMRRGFTQVEILVVIAIIAVLAGLLYPIMNAAKNRAWHTVCADNLHQLGVAEHLYANDNEGWVSPATTAETDYLNKPLVDPALVLASPAVLRKALDPYVKSDDVWFCPTDPYARKNVLWFGQRHLLTSYWILPFTPGQPRTWPPRMQLMRDPPRDMKSGNEDVPLICDACGFGPSGLVPSEGYSSASSNHPDNMVNIVHHDLSLTRKSANFMLGVSE